ncbi:MAG: hypothetical protein IID40_05125 [Planctomycetes bacterium]|nr:hypothetical protein [Planctomycetota bacterium]
MNEPTARVLDVGNCDPDHTNIRALLEDNFAVGIDRVMFVNEALAKLTDRAYSLVLVNRLIFDDGSDGGRLIREMQAGDRREVPVMLISNYAEAQEKAVSDGAVRGFGKAVLDDPATVELLAAFLPRS